MSFIHIIVVKGCTSVEHKDGKLNPCVSLRKIYFFGRERSESKKNN